MEHPTVTIVGGGAFTPRLCEALARADGMPDIELRLTARRKNRLQVIADHATQRVLAIRPNWRVQASDSLEAAFEGADAVIFLVRVGGLAARSYDEEFPRRFGLIGDEGLGPGGFANAYRTLPEFNRMVALLKKGSPGARVLNLIAPLGITTRLLLDAGIDAIGVCELPLVTLEALARLAEVPVEATSSCYGGLNHLGWFWNARADGEDFLRSAGVAKMVDTATLERYQAAPLHYFYEIFDREAGVRLGLERKPGRANTLLQMSERAVVQFALEPGADIPELEHRNTPWFDRAVAPILAALLGGPAHHGFANLRNDGLIPELPEQIVVEVAATYERRGVHPRAPGPLPEAVAEFLRAAGRSEDMAYRAACEQNLDRLAEAIRALPLSISSEAVVSLAKLAAAELQEA